jgi:MOSC domain-containing protein YiiM
MNNQIIATGVVKSLSMNGSLANHVYFSLAGPVEDTHAGMTRRLDGHDAKYIATSQLERGYPVFNWRSWTGLSLEEVILIERQLGVHIPRGCLLENIVLSGIPRFSLLQPTSRLVFPKKADGSQLILTVWQENTPCKGVGDRLQKIYPTQRNLSSNFISEARGRRGVMGFVLSAGYAEIGDDVMVFPPVE